jgi:hypothetical protein
MREQRVAGLKSKLSSYLARVHSVDYTFLHVALGVGNDGKTGRWKSHNLNSSLELSLSTNFISA